jgi:hypothetical protein
MEFQMIGTIKSYRDKWGGEGVIIDDSGKEFTFSNGDLARPANIGAGQRVAFRPKWKKESQADHVLVLRIGAPESQVSQRWEYHAMDLSVPGMSEVNEILAEFASHGWALVNGSFDNYMNVGTVWLFWQRPIA